MAENLDFELIKKYVFSKLEKELPPNLYYHGIHHTRDDVLPAFERLAEMDGVKGDDLLVGKTAVLYHDIGYVEQYIKNEPIGVRIANETLPTFGYSPNQINKIGQIIMATQLQMVDGKLVQVPDKSDLLQLIMCDADLDALGREDFFITGENLRRELSANGMHKSLRAWYETQLAFQESHKYFTNAAKKLRNAQKKMNTAEIRDLLRIA